MIEIPQSFIDRAAEISRRAGRTIMEIYESGFEVETKDDKSPVTEADRRAEKIIVQAIRSEITGLYPIIAEEAAAAGDVPDLTGRNEPFWLVDPLDGTKEFIRKSGEFTVNIALIDAGRPVLGVVYAPAIGEMFIGGPTGAFAETPDRALHPITCRKTPAEGMTAVVSRSHKSPETNDFLAPFAVHEEVSAGSSLKFCRIAMGRADIYPRLGRTMEWDTAAGHAVLEAAGGAVTRLDRSPFDYGKPGFENPHFVACGADIPWPED